MPVISRIINPENSSAVDRVINATNTAEGSVLPNRQIGPSRVPLVTGLKILSQEPSFNNNVFTLTWLEPTDQNIAGYQIYYKIDGQTPVSLSMVQHAPAMVPVVYTETTSNKRVTFYIQTILKNGFVSDINLSPTVAASFQAMNLNFNASTTVQENGVTIATRPTLNFIDGTNTTVAITDDAVNNRVDVEISSSGGGGSVADGDYGDITVSGTGTVWTVDNDVVTYAKMQNVSAASRILGRGSASGAGDVQELTIGSGLSLSGTTLTGTALADGDKGDITVTGSGATWTIDPDAVTTSKILDANVTYAKIQDVTAASKLLGRGDSGSGDVQEITLGSGLAMSGTTLTSTGGISDGDKGDITVTASGATWTIDSGVVTYAKMQNMTTDRLLGRDTAGSGSPEELTVSGGVEFTGTGIQRSALTGDVTASAGSNATTIANNAVTTVKILDAAVTYAKIQDVSAASKLLGRGDSGSGDVQEITLGTNLSMSGTTINASGSSIPDGDKGDITTSSGGSVWTIDNDAVTFAKMQNSSAASVLVGRGSASGAGDFQEITLGSNLSMSGTTLSASGGGISDGDKGDITVSSSGAVWTIDNMAVTYAKMQDVSAASKLLGRGDSGSGSPQEITLGTGLSMSGTTLNSSGGGVSDGDKGDITVSSSGTVWTIDNDVVTFAKMQNIGTGNVLGRYSSLSGDVQELAVTYPLTASGGTLATDATLTALAGLSTNGLLTQTATDTFTARTLTGGTGVTISNGDGVSGNPSVSLDATLVALAGYNTNGLLTQTAADTFTGRTITAGNGISITNGNGVSGNPTIAGSTAALTRSIGITVDGGGSTITTGSKGFIYLPFAGTITQVVLLANASGSCVIDIKKSTYSGFPTTSSICASAKPTLSSAQKSKDSTLTGWTTSFSADDVLEFNVDSATTVTRVNLILSVSIT